MHHPANPYVDAPLAVRGDAIPLDHALSVARVLAHIPPVLHGAPERDLALRSH
jgi:hypothetical protein